MIARTIGSAAALVILIFLASLLPTGNREMSPLENIHGIQYPKKDNATVITEPLAHADIFLQEPVLAKNLTLKINFKPMNLTSLSVGIREDSFWLSYGSKQTIFQIPNSKFQIQNSTLTIPLTDKLQETDRSLDLMFFAEAPAGQEPLWELHDLKIKTSYAKPTYTQFKNYVRSIFKHERAL